MTDLLNDVHNPDHGAARGNRARTTSDVTTTTFPIKRIVIDGQHAQQKQLQPSQKQPKKASQTQQQNRQQRAQQQIDPSKIEEARKAAIQAAKLASRGAVFSDFSSKEASPQNRNAMMPPLPILSNAAPMKKLKRKVTADFKKHVATNDERIGRSIGYSSGRYGSHYSTENQLQFSQKRDLQRTIEEEGDGMEDNISTSFTFGARTETTCQTNAATTDSNEPTTTGHVSKPSPKNFFPLSPKSIFHFKGQKKKEVEEFDQLSLLDYDRTQLANLQQKQRELRQAQALLNAGAWTCGVCGTPFGSLPEAERHELICLVTWVKYDRSLACGLQEKQPQRSDTATAPAARRTGSIDADAEQHCTQQTELSQPPSPRLFYYPPNTGGDIILPSPTIKKYISMTDDAAVKIARRARSVLFGLCRQELFSFSNPSQRSYGTKRSSITSAHSTATSFTEPTGNEGWNYGSIAKNKSSLLLLYQELDAQRELALLARDRQYYNALQQHSMRSQRGSQSSSINNYYYYQYARMGILGDICLPGKDEEGEQVKLPARLWNNVKNKFEHAYELIKEGPESQAEEDQYSKSRNASGKGGASRSNNVMELVHDRNTLYVNVVVKNSVQVVNNELQRIARGWWESSAINKNAEGEAPGTKDTGTKAVDFEFEWIRAHTQKKVIQLAGLALASDFTPRKVAVQLSNDLFRLMGPQLEIRGVSIHTDIEYRVGAFFCLAVNVLDIDWILLMEHTRKMVSRQHRHRAREHRIRKAGTNDKDDAKEINKKPKKKTLKHQLAQLRQLFPSRNEIVAQVLAFMNHLHFLVALPLLHIFYCFPPIKYAVNKFILAVVTDDIFRYVEKKGMEMQLEIKGASQQASFMLAALRELREDDKRRRKKKEGEEIDEDYKPIIGPLLGPAIKDDKNEAKVPADVSLPEALEFVGLEVDLPVGFQRLRWALLSSSSKFFKDAFLSDVLNYDKITLENWSSHEDQIGLPSALDDSFLNITREYSYLMPKSAFVKANMCYATLEIIYYDDYCFVMKEKTLTPEVPYGNSFVAWTQYSIINTGNDTCKMICSVQAEFPNGPPMVARQIKSGMRSGTAEKFVLLGETICRYADAFP